LPPRLPFARYCHSWPTCPFACLLACLLACLQVFEFQPDPGLQGIAFERPDLLEALKDLGGLTMPLVTFLSPNQ
jgi:hypothetical protein